MCYEACHCAGSHRVSITLQNQLVICKAGGFLHEYGLHPVLLLSVMAGAVQHMTGAAQHDMSLEPSGPTVQSAFC